jgi:hypothetical protein
VPHIVAIFWLVSSSKLSKIRLIYAGNLAGSLTYES